MSITYLLILMIYFFTHLLKTKILPIVKLRESIGFYCRPTLQHPSNFVVFPNLFLYGSSPSCCIFDFFSFLSQDFNQNSLFQKVPLVFWWYDLYFSFSFPYLFLIWSWIVNSHGFSVGIQDELRYYTKCLLL